MRVEDATRNGTTAQHARGPGARRTKNEHVRTRMPRGLEGRMFNSSGRGNVFWTSDPNQTNTGIVASGQVSSYQSLTVAGTGASDEIKWYPSVYQP